MTEYENMTPVERAVADARKAFENVIGHHYVRERRSHSLYMLKGAEVRSARYRLEYGLGNARIKHGNSPNFYLPVLRECAEQAIKHLQRAKITKVNEERIGNSLSQLEDVVEYTAQAEAETEAARARKEAEELTRWPEDKERAQEIQMWGMCLTQALNIIQNFGLDPNADGEGVWGWTPTELATSLSDIREEHDEHREALSDIINALDDENIEFAWRCMYDFAKERKGADA